MSEIIPYSEIKTALDFKSKAEEIRFCKIIEQCAEKAFINACKRGRLAGIEDLHYSKISRWCRYAMEDAMKKQASRLLNAAKVTESQFKKYEINKIYASRKNLSESLKKSKKHLSRLSYQIQKKENDINELNIRIENLERNLYKYSTPVEYQDIPPPSIIPNELGYPELEGKSGIYFIWLDSIIVYVGQSINLSNRLKFGHHHQIKSKNEKISVLEVPREHLTWTENFYIGICRPVRNYGSIGSHNKYL